MANESSRPPRDSIAPPVAEKPVSIDDSAAIATSYPGFLEDMDALGASIAADG